MDLDLLPAFDLVGQILFVEELCWVVLDLWPSSVLVGQVKQCDFRRACCYCSWKLVVHLGSSNEDIEDRVAHYGSGYLNLVVLHSDCNLILI